MPCVDLDPADNPYLHWILKGDHGAALPLAWRAEHFDTIRDRLDRLDIRAAARSKPWSPAARRPMASISPTFSNT